VYYRTLEHSQPWMGNLIMLNPLITFAIDGENTTSNIHCQRLTTMKMNILREDHLFILYQESLSLTWFAGLPVYPP